MTWATFAALAFAGLIGLVRLHEATRPSASYAAAAVVVASLAGLVVLAVTS